MTSKRSYGRPTNRTKPKWKTTDRETEHIRSIFSSSFRGFKSTRTYYVLLTNQPNKANPTLPFRETKRKDDDEGSFSFSPFLVNYIHSEELGGFKHLHSHVDIHKVVKVVCRRRETWGDFFWMRIKVVSKIIKVIFYSIHSECPSP